MKRFKLPLQTFRLHNFKSVQDSGVVRFTPLTVFIGNNGSGKSSVVEGLETLQSIVVNGLDEAMQQWHGFEHIWNQASRHVIRRSSADRLCFTNPMRFEVRGNVVEEELERRAYYARMEVNMGPGENDLFISREECIKDGSQIIRKNGQTQYFPKASTAPTPDTSQDAIKRLAYEAAQLLLGGISDPTPIVDWESIVSQCFIKDIRAWQFLSLSPQAMVSPLPQKRTGGQTKLTKDGANIAEYLLSIRKIEPAAIEGIIETLQYVLPYARDVQPALASELERTVYLQMTESGFKLPGWLLSTGTLRILALLALFRHPSPPPLIVIEEIENGLDPRTIHLIVDEIRHAVQSGRSQVILTTHSPYLLDLLTLSQIIMVERDRDGSPVFTRPAEQAELQEWARKFGPGKLYTMNQLGRESGA